MSEDIKEEKDFGQTFQEAIQPVVNLLSGTNSTHLYLSRRRVSPDEWSNEWDIIVVDSNTKPLVNPVTEEPIKAKKTRKNKSIG